MNYAWMETPIGRLLLISDDNGLRRIDFANGNSRPDAAWHDNPAALKETIGQLGAYFASELKEFDVPLAPEGTQFQNNLVWRTCTSRRQSQGFARRRPGEWREPDSHHYSLPSRDWKRWQAHRIRRWPFREGDVALTRSTRSSALAFSRIAEHLGSRPSRLNHHVTKFQCRLTEKCGAERTTTFVMCSSTSPSRLPLGKCSASYYSR